MDDRKRKCEYGTGDFIVCFEFGINAVQKKIHVDKLTAYVFVYIVVNLSIVLHF